MKLLFTVDNASQIVAFPVIDSCRLEFKNAIVRINQPNNDIIFAKCQMFNVSFNVEDLNTKYWFDI